MSPDTAAQRSSCTPAALAGSCAQNDGVLHFGLGKTLVGPNPDERHRIVAP
jgi:hypothetical protein